jgi:hypothetical protein
MSDVLIFGAGTNSLSSNQSTQIYLDDYTNKELTKQNLLDMLLEEIYDVRDGDILKHVNNVQVDITRISDNVLVESIIEEGFYEIRMLVVDNDNNEGRIYWKNRIDSLETDVLKILIRENKAPIISLNDKRVFNLADYQPSYSISREIMNNELVYTILDDRDGLIVANISNTQLFQIGEESVDGTNGTNGSNWFYPTYSGSGSGSGIALTPVEPPLELLYINEIGEYEYVLTIKDSDNSTTQAVFRFNVYN